MNPLTLKELSLTSLAKQIITSPPEIRELIISETDLYNSKQIKLDMLEQFKALPYIMKSIALDIFLNRFDRLEYSNIYKTIDKELLDIAIESAFSMINELRALNFSFDNFDNTSINSDSEESVDMNNYY